MRFRPVTLIALFGSFALLAAGAPAQAQDGPPDRDGDWKADADDQCPDDPEDDDGFEDGDGCPDYDNDGDGVPDLEDKCAGDREVTNGFQDHDGCPDAPPAGPVAVEPCADGRACKTAGDDAWKLGDMATAAARYRRACAHGDAGGCGALAIMMERGEAKAAYPDHVLALHRFACSKRVRESCHNLGLILRDGRGTTARPELATRHFGQACDLGLAQACTVLGRPAPAAPAPAAPAPVTPAPAPLPPCTDAKTCDATAWAAFGAKRFDEAARDGQKACDLGGARGCAVMSYLYEHGKGVSRDLVKALSHARKACAGGEQSGCHNVAFRLAAGDVVPQDLAEARRLYDAACKTGLKPSCDQLAKLPAPDPLAPMLAAFDKKDYKGALALGKPLCDGGDVGACAVMGTARWELGRKSEAIALWQQACDGKVGWACYELAEVHWSGNGAREDKAKGLALAKRGCELGYPEACRTAGSWGYLQGEVGVTWFVRACDLKEAEGCSLAAHSYRVGDFGPKDPALAHRYARSSCELGYWNACADVGRAECDGLGTPKDVTACERHLRLGCVNDDDASCEELHGRFD